MGLAMLEKLKFWALLLKRDVIALYLAGRDPRVPWSARLLALAAAAYALSPIDLIPDVIPVIGYLDDLLIVPLLILLAIKLIPAELMTELRDKAVHRMSEGRPVSIVGAVFIVFLWLAAAFATAYLLFVP